MENIIEIRRYLTRNGRDLFEDWLSNLRDARAQAKIIARIGRLALGNFGDCKRLREGLCELPIDWGTRVQSLLRSGWQHLRFAVVWWRQEKAVD